jgi:Spy/CpxP family protein refolding chaperone
MTTIDNDNLPPEPAPAPGPNKKSGFLGWPRALAFGGVLVFGLALGAGGLALAAGMEHSGWDRGVRMAFVQRAVSRALDSVGATAQQEANVHDIIAAKFAELAPDPKEREALRKQAFDLLGAPTIDRAAVEKFRTDIVGRFDAKSKIVTSGLLEIADQLKPEQRAELMTRLERMRPGGPMGFGGWRHDGHGPDDGYDGGSDKD